MSRRIALWELIHAALLSVCIGAIVMVGAAAAVAFPAVRKLDPRLPGIQGYAGEHWKLIGGAVMNPAFHVADWVQYATVVGAIIAFCIARWPRKPARFSRLSLIRAVVLIAILAVSGYQAVNLRPRMDGNLRALWASARSGNDAAAQVAKAAFDADHGPASLILECSLGLILLAAILSGCSIARSTSPEIPA